MFVLFHIPNNEFQLDVPPLFISLGTKVTRGIQDMQVTELDGGISLLSTFEKDLKIILFVPSIPYSIDWDAHCSISRQCSQTMRIETMGKFGSIVIWIGMFEIGCGFFKTCTLMCVDPWEEMCN